MDGHDSLSRVGRPPTTALTRALWLAVLLSSLALIELALRLASPEPSAPVPRAASAEPPAPKRRSPPDETPLRAIDMIVIGEPSPASDERAAAHAPDASAATDTELRRPHPITDEHRRIFRENNLVGAMNGALDVGDYQALRRMNADYRNEYPEDGHVLQEGYDLIADCLEERNADTRARAEQFWKTRRSSQLRRYVRRHCLAGARPGGDERP